jgi:hypothetical protein
MKMLEKECCDRQQVDDALDQVGDQSLEAEVLPWRGIKKWIKNSKGTKWRGALSLNHQLLHAKPLCLSQANTVMITQL